MRKKNGKTVKGSDNMHKGERIIYQTEGGFAQINRTIIDKTFWLTQKKMSNLFDTSKQNINLHPQNIFEDSELLQDTVVKDSLTTASDRKQYQIKIYKLDTVGFRIHSLQCTQSHRWANTVLQQYLFKSFAMVAGYRLKTVFLARKLKQYSVIRKSLITATDHQARCWG